MTKLFTEIKKNFLEEEIIWKSPERIWKKKKREWYLLNTTFFLIILVFTALLKSYLFMVLIISFIFLWFVQASVKPEIIEHKINIFGIHSFNEVFKWANIESYFFSVKDNKFLLIFDTNLNIKELPRRVILILEDKKQLVLIYFFLKKRLKYSGEDIVGFGPVFSFLYGKYIKEDKIINIDVSVA